MTILKAKDIGKMTSVERKDKIKELKIELIKSKVGNKKAQLSTREIKKTIARLLTVEKLKSKNKEKK